MIPRITLALLALLFALPAQASLLLWYNFNDGAGALATDSLGYGNNLSAVDGGVLWNQKAGAPFGGSIHFNGTGSVRAQKLATNIQGQTIDMLRARSGQKVTIAFWTNPDTQGQATSPFGFLKGTTGRVLQPHLLWTNSNLFWDMGYVGAAGDTYYRANVATTSTPGTWTHWVFQYDGTSATPMKVFRNNVQIINAATGLGGSVNWAGIDTVDIGTSQIYGTRWAGSIDDFALWDEALTPAQIFTIYTSGVQTLVPPVISSFKATPGNITPGGTAALSWVTSQATTLSINNGVGTVTGASGSVNVSPGATTTYTLTATNASASVTRNVVLGVGATEQPLQLTEFLADNSSGLLDEDGTAQDWIELYNPNVFAVNTSGWKLVNGTVAQGFTEWTIPALQLEAGQRIVVFASSKNRTNPAATLHTNFKLDPNGEYLALKKPDGSIATELTYGAQRKDISGGLSGVTNVYFLTPTPGAANGTGVFGFVGDTAFSIGRGFYSSAQSVAITCVTLGTTIRYTTDYSTPTETNGTIYTAPISIAGHTVLRARAFLTNYAPSNTDTQSYIFLSDVLNQIYSSPPAGWPASGLNGQVLVYGLNSTLKAQYTTQQLLDALQQLPSLSVTTDQANLTNATTGIYVNALNKGDDWEKPATAEYIYPNPATDGFHVHCGLRIRGGYSRNDAYEKHSFRLFFRNEYGESKLTHPLFGTGGATEFQTIDLRCEQNYAFANDGGTENTAVREVFCRDLMRSLGEETTRSNYFHLYLNGQYWGLYQWEERAQEDFGAEYFGGNSADYDVVQTSNHSNFFYELGSGTLNAWQQTWNLARACATSPTNANYFALLGRDANGVRVPAMPVYVDPNHLATYMLLHYYTGDGDGPLSNFLGLNRANNWRGFRNRLTNDGWRFFPHDCEHTLLAPSWLGTRATGNAGAGTTPTNGANRTNFTYSNSEWLHEDLATNPEYRLKIADIAQKHLFNGGALTPAAAQSLFDARAAQIDKAIVGDAVRWGTSTANHTLAQWNARLGNIRTNFFPARHTTVLGHLQTRGFYPVGSNPPTFSQRGGQVAAGYPLTMNPNGQTGTIYYTTDDSDPRAVGGAPTGIAYTGAITIGGITRIKVRFLSSGGTWSALDDVSFTTFPPAVGGKIVVSKIHYHPTNPTAAEALAGYGESDFEYIELQNITAAETLDLGALSIAGGIAFHFSSGTIPTLAPGARVVVAGNLAAFTARYGAGLPVAGAFTGDLGNSGDAIEVRASGVAFITFTYDDIAPWPTAADGAGFALALKNSASNPNHASAANWRASYAPGGKPGAEDLLTVADWRTLHFTAAELGNSALESTLWGDLADPDADGTANLAEFALATQPRVAASRAATTAALVPDTGGTYLQLTARLREGITGVTVTAQASSTLTSWPDAPALVSNISQGDGTTLAIWQDTVPSTPGATRFARLLIQHP